MKADNIFEWYQQQIEEHGVDHPFAVGNGAETREEAIAEKASTFEALAAVDPRFKIAPGETVLEVGIGNMLVSDAYVPLGLDLQLLTGVEVVPEFAGYCRSRGVNVAPSLQLLAGRYDVSLAIGLLAGFEPDEALDMLKAIAERTTNRVILGFTCYPADGFNVPDISQMTLAFGDALSLSLVDSYCVGIIDMQHPNPHRD